MNATAPLSPFEILAGYERLALAHASGSQGRTEDAGLWRGIGYRVGPRLFVSAIEEINELLAVPALATVPGTKPWLLGIANVRGNLVPVIDFARFLFGERTPSTERTRLLIVRQPGGSVALMVDEVFGQRTMDEQQRELAQAEDDARLRPFVEGQVELGDQRLALFNMARLVRAQEFRQAAA